MEDPRRADGGERGGAREAEVDPLAASAVGDQRPAPGIDRMPPGIDPAAGEDSQIEGRGAESPHPAAVQAMHAGRGLDMAVDVDRLVEIEPRVDAPAEGVDEMVGVLGAEAGEDRAPRVGPAVAVGVGEVEHFRGVGDVAAAVAGKDGRRHVEPGGEHLRAIGDAVAVGVVEDRHRVVGDLAGAELRIDTRRRHPQPAARIEIDLEWLADLRVGGEQIHLVALGHLHRRQLRGRIGDGDIGEGALSRGDGGKRGDDEKGREEGAQRGGEGHVNETPGPAFAPSPRPPRRAGRTAGSRRRCFPVRGDGRGTDTFRWRGASGGRRAGSSC